MIKKLKKIIFGVFFGQDLRHHRWSVRVVQFITVCTIAFVCIAGLNLEKHNREYATREKELMAMIEDEESRSEEIDELSEYVGTDEYIESVAKEKLGLVYENEILFKAEH